MRTFIALFLSIALNTAATTNFTSFYVNNAGGDNLNSGSTPDAAALFTATGCCFTNNTTASTCTIFKEALNPTWGVVTNGAWASVYPDAYTATAFIGVITSTNATNIVISYGGWTGGWAGTVPASDTANGTSIKVGGAWKGFGTYDWTGIATNIFPATLVTNTMTNAAGNVPRVNIKGGTTYSVTNSITIAGNGPVVWQGYTNAVGDLGRATIDGGEVQASFVLVALSGTYLGIADLVFSHNGAVGSNRGITTAASTVGYILRCRAHGMGRSGFLIASAYFVIACEADGNNIQNNTGEGGFAASLGYFLRCVSHDNVGNANDGFYSTGGYLFDGCIAYNNGRDGFNFSSSQFMIKNCNSYSNVTCGLDMTKASQAICWIENCAFFRNKTFGINASGGAGFSRSGAIRNCSFGSGTMTNVSGDIGTTITSGIQNNMLIENSQVYTADDTPWVDPDAGNFTQKSAALTKAAGIGMFSQTNSWAALTVSYPDIGAAQAASTNAATAGTTAHTFAQ